jgi:hypothetical protein
MDSYATVNLHFTPYVLPNIATTLWTVVFLIVVYSLTTRFRLRSFGDFPIVGQHNDIYAALKEGTERVYDPTSPCLVNF